MSALSGLTDLSSATVNAVPELKAISLKAMEEALDVSQACGIGLERESVIKGMAMISKPGGTGDNKSSLCVDLLNGRKPRWISSTEVLFKLQKKKKFHSDSQSPAWIGQRG
jgi:2-dehydropantoate 2-reductase